MIMKIFLPLPIAIVALAALASIPSPASAQGVNSAPSAGQTAQGKESKGPEGIIKQGGRIALVRANKIILLDGALTFPNKLRVDPDGTITHPDKSQTTLQAGQMITMGGMVTPLQSGMPTGTVVTSRVDTQATGPAKSSPPAKAGEGTGAR